MTFWDHLDALRGVMIRICILAGILGTIFFCIMPQLFDVVILAPSRADFPLYRLFDGNSGSVLENGSSGTQESVVTIMNIRLASQFMVHMSASVWAAVIAGFPLIIYLLWTFVSPALYAGERRVLRRAFALGCLMFYCGILTAYFIVFPLTLRFLAGYQLSAAIANTVSLDSYIDTFFMTVLAMGLVFELPLLAWVLGKAGLVTRDFFRRYRRHAIVALLVAAAIITPTGDPVTLFAVFVPLYALWAFGSRLVPERADRCA